MKLLKYVTLLTLVIILVSACSPRNMGADKETVEVNKTAEAIPIVTKDLVKESVNEEVYVFGYLEPTDSYFTTPFSPGIVEEIFVEVGTHVKKDTLLFQLEANSLDSSKDKDLLQKESNIVNAKSSLDLQMLSLKQRENDLELRAMSLTTTKNNYEVTVDLFNSGISTQVELDGALNNYEQAQLNYSQAQLTYESTQLSYNSAQNSYNNALENNSISVNDYEDKYDDLLVVAPIGGLVTEITVQEGLMNQGSTGVTIIDDSIMILNVNIMEKYIHEIEVGQYVRLSFDYMENEKIGTVSSISLKAKAGYYPVEIQLENSDNTYTSGMYVEGFIQTKRIEHVFMIDKTSLMVDVLNQESYIYILNEDGENVRKVIVELGVNDGKRIEIKGDLAVGDKIVVIGQDFVVDGQLVVIQDTEEE